MRRIQGSSLDVLVFTLIGLTCAWLAAAPARAEDEEPADTGPAASTSTEDAVDEDGRMAGVEEIVVTSRKREEVLQNVPLSVTSVGARDLAELTIDDASGVAELSPNLVINRTSSGSTAYVTCMRGLCRTDTTLTDDPYVGIYMNGVYTGKAIGSVFEVADIQRIEVLRGPQGTLFGKNTIGGAVNVITKKPTGEAGARLEFLGGTDATTNFRAVVDLPRIGDFSTKIAYLTKNHDPYTANYFVRADGQLARALQDEDKNALLWDLLWEPTDRFYAEFVLDYTRIREVPWANLSTANQGIFADPFAPIQTSFSRQTVAYEEVGPGVFNHADAHGYALTMGLDLGDLGPLYASALKSITAYRRYENDYNVNAGALTYRNLWVEDRFETSNISQELQFSAYAIDDRLSILAGFFYLREEGDYTNFQGFMAGPPFTPGTFSDLLFGTDVEYDSYALFTEESFEITDSIELTAGVRFTREDRTGGHSYTVVNSDGFVPGGGVGVISAVSWSTLNGVDAQGNPTLTKFKSSTWSPRVTLSWQALDDLMVFTGWTRGYKSGGFNARSITAPLWNPYGDQRVDSVELGFKSELFEDRARLNVTAFYEYVSDAQVQFNRVTLGGFEVLLANAGDLQIYGAEVESVIAPVDGLELRLGFGITGYEYEEVINPFNGVDEKNIRHLEFTPKYNWSVGARYVFPDFGFGVASLRADYSGQSDVPFNSSIADDRIVGQPPYGLLHVRLGVDEIDLGLPGEFGLALVGQNILEESYRVGGYVASVPAAGLYAVNVYGTPRFWGGQITYKWGSQR